MTTANDIIFREYEFEGGKGVHLFIYAPEGYTLNYFEAVECTNIPYVKVSELADLKKKIVDAGIEIAGD